MFSQKNNAVNCKLMIIHNQKIQWFGQSLYFISVIFVTSIYFDSKGALNTNPIIVLINEAPLFISKLNACNIRRGNLLP
jgi:hypothetical protein